MNAVIITRDELDYLCKRPFSRDEELSTVLTTGRVYLKDIPSNKWAIDLITEFRVKSCPTNPK